MAERRVPSKRYAELGERLIASEPSLAALRESAAVVRFLESDAAKRSRGRVVRAECERVPDKYRWAVPCDFTVTVFAPNVEGFGEGQTEALLLHELLHAGVEVGADGEERYRTLPHDLEDFREVLGRYGMDWDAV